MAIFNIFFPWLKTGFYEDLIEPERFLVSSLNQKDCLFWPKIVYNHNVSLKFILGADYFYGESHGTFGIFDEKGRVTWSCYIIFSGLEPMRTIKFHSIFVFTMLFSASAAMAFISAYVPYYYAGSCWFIFIVFGFLLFYLYAILLYRLFLFYFPLQEGFIESDSKQEFIYHVYLLCFLIIFYQLTRPKIIPVPILKIVYLILGAKLGRNTFCSGTILDPIFTTAGDNTIIGEDSCLFAHAIEGNHLSHKRIILGNNVTIGAKSILMSGVEVKDNSIVAAGSVVPKNTIINENEIWRGNPAKYLKKV